jgi:[acyl-carrier-protein] S-malonyltransferase
MSMTSLLFDGPDSALTETKNCQPALYTHGMMALAVLRELVPGFAPVAVAGLSLGEFTAHAAAGSFTFVDGLRLVRERGTLMQQACEATGGAMAAMIGGEESAVMDLARAVDVDAANFNAPGQIVLSGVGERIDAAVAQAKEYGIRKATKLNVAGAFHSRLMQSAQDAFEPVLAATGMNAPHCLVIANVDAAPSIEPSIIRSKLAAQVTGSVHWTRSIEYLVDVAGVELFLELGPKGVLAGFGKRIREQVPVVAAADYESLLAAVATL